MGPLGDYWVVKVCPHAWDQCLYKRALKGVFSLLLLHVDRVGSLMGEDHCLTITAF